MGVMSAMAQQQAAQEDFAETRDAYNKNVIASFAAARDEQSQLTLRHLEEQDATAAKLKLSQLQEAEAKAEARVASSAGGVSGLSIDSLLSDIGGRSALNRQAERRNFSIVAQQLQAEQQATIHRAAARVASLPKGRKPSSAPFLLGIAGAGLSGLSMAGSQGYLGGSPSGA
jgi:hypothetical protein